LISSGGETFHFGPQGETRVITDWSGAVTNSCLYTAYGVPVATTANWWPAFGFGGQFGYWTDNNSRQYYGPTGLILCGARWYSPKQGRWLSRDPIGYSGGSNLYAYCQSNPIGLVDPSGLQGGHHYVVGPIRNLTGLSNAAKRVFNATVGSTEPVHGWSVEHVRYNDRVARIWDVFLRRRSIKNIGTITEAQAQEFISWIRNSKHPDIVDFLAREERMAAETAARRAAVAAENACTESASIGSKAARATGLLLIVAPYAYYEGKLQAMAESGVKRDHRLLIQSDRQMLDWKDEERQDEEKLLRGIFVGRYKGRK
jgi:RHS repeat-associated protein